MRDMLAGFRIRDLDFVMEGPALKATGNEVAIESIELAHEGLEVQVG